MVIEAIQLLDDREAQAEIQEFLQSGDQNFSFIRRGKTLPGSMVVRVETLEGWMEGNEGDYLLKGVRGEFYFCRQDIFEETYAEVLT